MSLSFVRNLLRRYQDCGEIKAKQRGGYQKPTIQDEHLSIIKFKVEEKNDLLLSELCDRSWWSKGTRFAEHTGIKVSITTMHRAIEKLDLRVKKSRDASKQETPGVQESRHDYRRWLDKIDVRNLV